MTTDTVGAAVSSAAIVSASAAGTFMNRLQVGEEPADPVAAVNEYERVTEYQRVDEYREHSAPRTIPPNRGRVGRRPFPSWEQASRAALWISWEEPRSWSISPSGGGIGGHAGDPPGDLRHERRPQQGVVLP